MAKHPTTMKLYNTLTRSIEEFAPTDPHRVTMYACGFTVYDYAHIGHMRKYVMDDVLRRALMYLGYGVQHVQNVTDVGHLASDGDEGDDKMEKGAKKAGKTVWEVAKYFEEYFYDTMGELGVLLPNIICRATDNIDAMIDMIRVLEQKGFTYQSDEAIYFDISEFSTYGALSGQKIEDKKQAVREEVNIDPGKRHPADFALWFFRSGRFADHAMHWESPWGDGFPGWHIECSAMSRKYLGDQIDIHTGGIDHIPVHHENEIAQSEAASGRSPFVKYWFHNAFLMVDGVKMSKSLENFYTIDDVRKQGLEPRAMRLLFYTTHYRQTMNFTWDAARAAQTSFNKLIEQVRVLRTQSARNELSEDKLVQVNTFQQEFQDAIGNDLNMSAALSVLWKALKSNIPSPDKLDLLYQFDEVLGLGLRGVQDMPTVDAAEHVVELAKKRQAAKQLKDWDSADAFRAEIEQEGYVVVDTPAGYELAKKKE